MSNFQDHHAANGWAAQIGHRHTAGLIHLRDAVGVELLQTQDSVWLKGPSNTDDSSLETVRRVLGATRFWRTDDDQLVPMGKRVPVMQLPEGEWQPLRESLELVMPVALLGGRVQELPKSSPLNLVRQPNSFTDLSREPDLLVCRLEDWCDFAAAAAEVRLNHLRFVCNEDQTVIVSGSPLPEIAGRRFVSYGRVAIEIGWSWSPEISPAALFSCFRIGPDRSAIWMAMDSWTSVADAQWIAANRNSIRQTVRTTQSTTQD